MANWNDPVLTTAYATFLSNMKDRDVDCAKMDFSAATTFPTGTIQYVVASNKFQRWNGAAWVDLVLAVAGGGTGGTTSLGTMAFQSAGAVAITGGTIVGISTVISTSINSNKLTLEGVSPPAGEATKGILFFDSATNKLRVRENNGASINVLQVASEVPNTPSGGIVSTNVQAAINEIAGLENHGGVAVNPYGITAAINVFVWIAPYFCTVTAVKGYRVGGTGATVNARKNGSLNHLASALSLTAADTVMDGGAVQNTQYQAGDKMEIMVVSTTGSPTQLGIVVYFTRAA